MSGYNINVYMYYTFEQISTNDHILALKSDYVAAKENPDMEIAVYAAKLVNESWVLDAHEKIPPKKWEELSNTKLWIMVSGNLNKQYN